jgi:hypothetical protein
VQYVLAFNVADKTVAGFADFPKIYFSRVWEDYGELQDTDLFSNSCELYQNAVFDGESYWVSHFLPAFHSKASCHCSTKPYEDSKQH